MHSTTPNTSLAIGHFELLRLAQLHGQGLLDMDHHFRSTGVFASVHHAPSLTIEETSTGTEDLLNLDRHECIHEFDKVLGLYAPNTVEDLRHWLHRFRKSDKKSVAYVQSLRKWKAQDYNWVYTLRTKMPGNRFFSIYTPLERIGHLGATFGHLLGDPHRDASRLVRLLQLGDREKEVLRLACDGATTQEISDRLFISTGTVRKHRSNILKKLDEPSFLRAHPYRLLLELMQEY